MHAPLLQQLQVTVEKNLLPLSTCLRTCTGCGSAVYGSVLVSTCSIWMVSLDRLEQLIWFKRKKENMTYDMDVNTQWHSGVVLSPWKRALEPQRDNVGCEGVYLSTNCFYNPLMQWSLEQLNDCPVLNSQGRMRCEP